MKASNALSTLRVVIVAFGMIVAFGVPTFGQEAPLQNEASTLTPAPAMNEVVQQNIEDWARQGRGVPNDWSHHHLVFSNPGTEQDAIANGTHDRWLSIVNDPRYIIQQLKRRAAQGPAAADIASIEETAQAQNAASAERIAATQDPTPAAKRKKSKMKKDWTEPLGSGAAATLTGVVGTLSSSTISGSSTLTVDGVTFHASPPTAATGSITVGSPYCFAGGDGVKINGVNITTNATKANGTVTFSGAGGTGETVAVAGIIYTFHGSQGGCGTENATNVCVMHGTVATDSSDDLEAAINNNPSQCSSTGKAEGGGTTCFFTSPSQANPTVTATISGDVVTVTPRCAGAYGMTACSSSHCSVSATTVGSNGSAGAGTFPLPAAASNTTVATSMAAAIGTDTLTDFVTAAAASGVVTLTGQNPGTTDNVTLALDGTPTGLTLSGIALTGGTNGTTSGASSPPTFAYWSGATYLSAANVATNIATAVNANTTVHAVITATANSPASGDVTFTADSVGAGGNSYSVAEVNFSAFAPTGSLSGGGIATVQPNMYPAVYVASYTSASCSDFAVYPTGQAGSASAANIIAYSNLYAGGCTAPVPSVYWAYNTGAYAVTTSPIISLDGSQIAFIESNGTTASLVLIKWAAKTGESVTAPLTLTNSASNSLYRSCTPNASAPCMFTIAFTNIKNDTLSAPFYDFAGADDALYVGDDSGNLHRFTGVFVGNPAEAGSPWPVSLGTNKLSSPVYDSNSGHVIVGDMGGALHSVTAAGVIFGTAAGLGDAIADAPLVDGSAGSLYAFVTTSGSYSETGLNAVYEFSTGFTIFGTPGVEPVGTGGAGYYLYAGDFDNVYYESSSPPSGSLYVVGNTGAATGGILYRIPIIGGGMSTPTAVATITGAVHPWPSPANEFCNNGTSACAVTKGGSCGTGLTCTTSGTDYLFFSVYHSGVGGCTSLSGNGCILSYNISNPAAPVLSGSSNVNAEGNPGCWATGGIVVDNSSTTTGASQIYFVNLNGNGAGGPTSGTSALCTNNVGTNTILAVQASQSSP